MKKCYLTFLLFALVGSLSVSAQTAQGCDGVRYHQDVFEDVEVTTVYYGSNTDAAGTNFDLEMEIYQPVGDVQEKRPLMIWSHGGAFITGDRTDMNQYCLDYAKKGFVTATISYRLYPVPVLGIPDSIEMMDAAMKSLGDLKAAIRHFRKDADTDNLYRIDTDYIVVAGVSAGAIMAVHAAYLDEDDDIPAFVWDVFDENGGIEGSTGDAANQSYSSDVVAVINLSGALHRRGWMSSGEPPIASYQGTEDEVVPYNHGVASVLGLDFMSLDGSGVMHQRADDLGILNYHVAAPGGGHSTSYESDFDVYFDEFIEGGLDFMQTVLCSDLTSTNEADQATAYVNLYPNPAKGSVTMEVSEYGQGYTVSLYDQMGRQLKTYPSQYDSAFTMERGDLGSGVYYVQVNFEAGSFAPVLKKITFQ